MRPELTFGGLAAHSNRSASGVHAIVEDAEVDAGWQLVAALRVPISLAIDRLHLIDRHRPHVGGRGIGLHVLAVVRDRDPEICRPAYRLFEDCKPIRVKTLQRCFEANTAIVAAFRC